MRRPLRAALALALGIGLAAHIGSPDVWYDGPAGPYQVRVLIKPPPVIPGLADIIVRVHGGGAERVLVTPSHWNAGEGAAPPPDEAEVMRDDPEVFTAQLWLMARGAYRITVQVEGPNGSGAAIVPVEAQATTRLEMSRATGGALIGVGIFLFIGLMTLVGSAVREGVLPPGAVPDAARRRRARFAAATSGLLAALLLFGGWRWWDAVDTRYRARLDAPWSAVATAQPAADARLLRFEITDSLWTMRNDPEWLQANRRYRRPPLIPDHGKLMHMFVIREPALDAFAHLHPVTRDSVTFDVALPAELPAGRYTVYADIAAEDGSARTMLAETTVPERATSATPPTGAAPPAPDADDAGWTGAAFGELPTGAAVVLDDGTTLRWVGPMELAVGAEADLRFEVLRADGTPAALEPYMGMAGHVMIRKHDGSVFVHLHPIGTVSAASLRAHAELADQPMSAHAAMAHGAPGIASFPYAFPSAGHYRVWLQVKIDGAVRTGAWDVRVD